MPRSLQIWSSGRNREIHKKAEARHSGSAGSCFLALYRFVNHTDHRAVGISTIDAVFPAARNPMTFPELKKEGLDIHRVKQVYVSTAQTLTMLWT